MEKKIIVHGCGVWEKADTEAEAIRAVRKRAGKPWFGSNRTFYVYKVHPDTSIDEDARWCYPLGKTPGENAPEFVREFKV